jgi:TPR repeat protein
MQVLTNAIRTALLVSIISLGVGSAGVAGPYEGANGAYDRGDFETALRLWQPLADQGNADAQRNLGLMYANGRGVAENDAKAVKWERS